MVHNRWLITYLFRYLEETRSTLQFAARAKLVKTNATVNEVIDERTKINRLTKELEELKAKLSGNGTAAVSGEDLQKYENEKELLQQRLRMLEVEKAEQGVSSVKALPKPFLTFLLVLIDAIRPFA